MFSIALELRNVYKTVGFIIYKYERTKYNDIEGLFQGEWNRIPFWHSIN